MLQREEHQRRGDACWEFVDPVSEPVRNAPLSDRNDDGRAWWLWTCLTGFGFGLFGYEYCRRRKAARAARAEDEPGT